MCSSSSSSSMVVVVACGCEDYVTVEELPVLCDVVKGDGVACGLNNASAVVFLSSTKNRLSCTSALAGQFLLLSDHVDFFPQSLGPCAGYGAVSK